MEEFLVTVVGGTVSVTKGDNKQSNEKKDVRLKVNHSWKKGGTLDGQVGQPSASFITLANRFTLDSDKFILDTGATVTLVNDAAMLHDYEPLTNTSYVRVANKETMQVVGEGTLIFSIGDTRLHIPHVGYVPQLSENLISPKVP